MYAIAILAGEAPVIVLGRIIVGPHGVDAVLVEEGVPGTLTEPDYSTMALVSEGREGCHAHPVEVGIVHEVVNLEESIGLTLLHVEADHERICLDDDVTADCLALGGCS
jgi:hypothetical protein